jgi:hypothetical protein
MMMAITEVRIAEKNNKSKNSNQNVNLVSITCNRRVPLLVVVHVNEVLMNSIARDEKNIAKIK